MSERLWMIRARGVVLLFIIFLAGLAVGVLYRHQRPAPKRPYLMAAFLDIGAGDCTLIRTPHGRVIMVDTGPADAQPLLAQALRQQNVKTIDLLVLASDAPGSEGGLTPLIASGVSIRQVWTCSGFSPSDPRLAPLRTHQIACETAYAGDSFSGDGATLTALWPSRSGQTRPDTALACRLDFGAARFVLAAPLDAAASRHLVADTGDGLSCDILVVPDGGVDGATTPELLRRATPSIAVISCAAGQPGPLTLRRLDAAGAVIYRTDTDDAITVFADGVSAPIVKDKPVND